MYFQPPNASVKMSRSQRVARLRLTCIALVSLLVLLLAVPGATTLAAPPTVSRWSPASASPVPDPALTPRPPVAGSLHAYAVTQTLQGAQVCGEITADAVWTAATGVYIVTCDVHVRAGVTLTLEPGITVKFQHANDDLIVSGVLAAVGAEAAPIVFQPAAGTEPGSWGRVAFLAGSAGVLDHVNLEYGGHEDGMLYLASERVQVLNSLVQFSADTGIVIQTIARAASQFSPPINAADADAAGQVTSPPNGSDLARKVFLPTIHANRGPVIPPTGPLISNTQVLSNTGLYGGGLYNESGSPTIQGNTFAGNTVDGVPWVRPAFGAGLYNWSGNPHISDNTFTNNGKPGQYAFGGGLYNNSGSPLIENNTFSENQAGYRTSGGGLYNASGSPTIVNNTFAGNYAEQDGGGLLNQSGSPIIRNNRFTDNSASGRTASGYGGGLANRSGSPVIENNLFTGNQIGGIYGPGYGGGLFNGGPNATIRNNIFRSNSANGYGGGLHNFGASAAIRDNRFTGNTAYYGGGLANEWFSAVIENNVFDGNTAAYTGGGLENLSGNPTIQNNIFINNAFLDLPNPDYQLGGGLYNSSGNPQIRNNIFASNTGNTGGGLFISDGSPVADYNDVWNNTGGDYAGIAAGPHDLAVDPLFVDAAGGDFHLAAGSPCIDAGDPTHFAATDFEGDVRPQGAAPDIGADEFRATAWISREAR